MNKHFLQKIIRDNSESEMKSAGRLY